MDNNNFGDDNVSDSGSLDLSLPMEQLLKLMEKRKKHNTSLISEVPPLNNKRLKRKRKN